jgi:hypothetical protein
MNYGKEFQKFAMSEKGISGLNLDYYHQYSNSELQLPCSILLTLIQFLIFKLFPRTLLYEN